MWKRRIGLLFLARGHIHMSELTKDDIINTSDDDVLVGVAKELREQIGSVKKYAQPLTRCVPNWLRKKL